MTVKEYIRKYRITKAESGVFFIKDTVDRLAYEFSLEMKEETNKWKQYENKYKLFFYYIFIHNVTFGSTFNNQYGFWSCANINFKKIDARRYKRFIEHMSEHQLIIYPIKSRSTGTDRYTKSRITKIVKVADELVSLYDKEQLDYFGGYLIEKSDPEGLISFMVKIGYYDLIEERLKDTLSHIELYKNQYIANYNQNKVTKNIELIKTHSNILGYNEIDKELTKQIILDKNLDVIVKIFSIENLNIYEYLNRYKNICEALTLHKYLLSKKQRLSLDEYINQINLELIKYGLPEIIIKKSHIALSNSLFVASSIYPHLQAGPDCVLPYIISPTYGDDFLINNADIFDKLINLIDRNGMYNIIDIYKLIEIDEGRLREIYDLSKQEDRLIYTDTLKKYNSQTYSGKIDNRIFTWFHSVNSRSRKAFKINGSYLKEAFDIHACAYCILAKLFELINYVKINPEKLDEWNEEVKLFQSIVKNDYIYKQIAEYGHIDLVENKRVIKRAAQTWLNMMNSSLSKSLRQKYFANEESKNFKLTLRYVDKYFSDKFPLISEVLKNWKVEKKKRQNKNKRIQYSKTIWRDYQHIEYNLITEKICNYLYFTYGVLPVTVHDALYLTDADYEYVSQYEDLEKLFWSLLNLKYFPESREIKRIKLISYIEQKFYNLLNASDMEETFKYIQFNKLFNKFYDIRNKKCRRRFINIDAINK